MAPRKPTRKSTARKSSVKKPTTRRGPESKSSARNLRNAEREVRVFELRVRGLTLQQIADELGYADRSGPAQAIDRVMARLHDQAENEADHWRQLLTARLEAVLAGPSREVAEANGITEDVVAADDAGVTVGSFGLMQRAINGQLGAIDRVVTIVEKLAKLHGAYAPERHEHTGADGAPLVPEVDAVAEFKRRLDDMAERVKQQNAGKKTTARKTPRKRSK